jgi:hypothetical protein
MTHMDIAGGYVKQIWLVLGWALGLVLCSESADLAYKMKGTVDYELSSGR